MDMPQNKAPRLYGFTCDFYKACWNFLGHEIYEVMEESRQLQSLWGVLNAMFLTLIPKAGRFKDPSDFRPI